MFLNLLCFEVKDRLWRLSSLVYFIVYFSISFMMAISFAGAFKGITVGLGLSNKLALNSPIVLNLLTCLCGYMGLLITAPIFGQSINKDFENKFSQILFVSPLRKSTYFSVRYLGSLISVVVIMTSVAFGLWIATLMPFVDQSLIAENHLFYYVAPYLTNVIPNALIFGAIFIAVVSIFKKMAPVYIASVSVFTGWIISQNITSDLDNKFVAAMIEPLGLEAASQFIRYWSVAEQSTQTIPLSGVFLYNRLLWGGIGLCFLIFAYISFNPFRLPKEKKKKLEEVSTTPPSFGNIIGRIPETNLNIESAKVLLGLIKSEFKQVFSNLYFLMILLFGVIYLFSISGQVGKMYGTETLPVTYHVLELVGGSFGLFIIILTTFYAGEIVWKDRDSHFYELVDSKPISSLYLYLSKLFSLFFIQLFLTLIIFICCVIIQIMKGYYHFEWDIYFEHLIIFTLPSKLMICVLALFIQSFSRNKYIGHFIMILYYILLIWLPSIGLDHYLYLVGQLPKAQFSDMNRYGTSLEAYSWFGLYWGMFHLVLVGLTILLWRRGTVDTLKSTLKEFKRRLNFRYRCYLYTAFGTWIILGMFVFYNTNILNKYETKAEIEKNYVDYELTYKSSYSKMAQPEITAVKLDVDIFPENQHLKASGVFSYKNKTLVPINKIFINLSKDIIVHELEWSSPAKQIIDDNRLEVKIFELETPLNPNEEIKLKYIVSSEPKGFKNSVFSRKIVQNGSFFYGYDFAPVVGYIEASEISDDKTRRKYNLPEKPRFPNVNDLKELNKTYISNEGTWINFEATVSTSSDQIAIAPGYLQKEWTTKGRRYFSYKMDKPILNFYAFLSARYEVVSDKWNDVNIQVYHHKAHDKNIPRMLKAVKNSLDYFSKNFSPYQFKQFRILEFPRYVSFAQAFPNTIPYSEAIGFIAKVNDNDPKSIDFPSYVTAHEVAHQWWAHQVIGGKVQGATLLSESLAQYSALMVQEKAHGPEQMQKFLKYELDNYLNGRSHEIKKELPLALNEGQPYIHYNKGSLVFYALKDYLGEDVVNGVLREFIKDFGFKDAPFPRAVDLVERFKKVTPIDRKYLIEDLFETITFYDNRTDSVSFKKKKGRVKVTIKGITKKVRADDLGNETEVMVKDLIDVGLFDEEGNVLYLKKHLLKSGENTIEIEIEKEPYKGGIDPINKLIDKVSDDNSIKAVEIK